MTDPAREVWARVAAERGVDASRFDRARPCFAVTERVPWTASDPVGGSRLGGAPDLPPELAWPVVDGARLGMVAQIDLSELAPRIWPALPERGWLWLFVGEIDSADDVPHRVLFWDGDRTALRRATSPAGTMEPEWTEDVVAPQRVRLEASFTLAGDDDEDELLSPDAATRVGGHTFVWHADSERNAYLSRSGLAPLRHRTHLDDAELAREIREAWTEGDDVGATELETARSMLAAYRSDEERHHGGIARWRPLLSIRSHREIEFLWWDAGYVHVLIDEHDLRTHRFDRTYCEIATS